MSTLKSVQKHRASLYLTFSPKCLPYAEVAQFYLTQKPRDNLILGISNDLLQMQPTLIIPRGIYSDSKQILKGKSNILKFFSSLSQSQFDLSNFTKINEIIDLLRVGPLDDPKLLKKLDVSSKFLVGDKISSADLFGWDYLLKCQKSNNWKTQLDQILELKDAKVAVDNILTSIPVLDHYKWKVVEQLSQTLNLDHMLIFKALLVPKFSDQGNLGLPIPALKLKGSPQVLAKEIAANFVTNKYIKRAFEKGVFVHFEFHNEILRKDTLRQVISMGSAFGSNSLGLGNLALCEFSSPNIAKPFHAGHLRSTIIGNFAQKLLQACGWTTVSINYLGDWGKQYGLLAVGYEKYGDDSKLMADPIVHLYEVYVKINSEASENEAIHDQARAYFKRMEDGDESALAMWKKFRDLSIIKYKEMFARLNVDFDVYSGESQFSLQQMKAVVDEMEAKNLLINDGGAKIVDLKQYKLGTAVIGKTDGSMLYLSRDIAAAHARQAEYGFDKMIYVVGTQQDHHFNQLFKILELMGKPWASKCEHIGFGMIKSKDGSMSTRKGTVVFLSDILNDVQEEMHEVMKKNEKKYAQIDDPDTVADVVGISAVMIQDLGAKRIKDYAFDWARMFSFEGDTGPYLQYAHARMCSIERLAEFKVTPESVANLNLDVLSEPQAAAVIDHIAAYPDLIREISNTMEPCALVIYALRLSHAVSSAISELWVAGQSPELAHPRLAMYVAARLCLGNALKMLGLKPLERM